MKYPKDYLDEIKVRLKVSRALIIKSFTLFILIKFYQETKITYLQILNMAEKIL